MGKQRTDPGTKARNLRRGFYRQNLDGSRSTVLMSQADNTAFPMLIPKQQGNGFVSPHDYSWWQYHPDDWQEAQAEAKRRGELFEFPSEQMARNFAQGSWKFDPNSKGYDYNTAINAGMAPKPGEHWDSREPESGMILKGKKHLTYWKTEQAERKLGNEIYEGEDGRYYSRPRKRKSMARPKLMYANGGLVVPYNNSQVGYSYTPATSPGGAYAPYYQTKQMNTKLRMGRGGYVGYVPQYEGGGFTNWFKGNAMGIGGAAGFLSGMIPGQTEGGSALKGALAGAGAGAALGPIGAGVGALVGGITSWIGKRKADKEKAEQERKAKEYASLMQSGANVSGDTSALGLYPTQGVEDVNYYAAQGGFLPDGSEDYLAEGGETIFHPNDQPMTNQDGNLIPLSDDMSEITGDSHNAPSSGVGMKGGEFIYSKRMKATKELENDIKDLVGSLSEDTTYSGLAAFLGRKRGKMEKKLESRDPIAINTAMEMLQRYDLALEMIASEQEYRKK